MSPETVTKLLNDQLLTSWEIYITFFTVFLTVNITAIGIVVTKVRKGTPRTIISVTFVLQNAIAATTGIMMARYSWHVANDISQLTTALDRFGPLGVWGGIGNSAGHIVIAAIWIMIIWTPGNTAENQTAT